MIFSLVEDRIPNDLFKTNCDIVSPCAKWEARLINQIKTNLNVKP